MIFLATSTKFGKSVFAVGSNEKAANLAGVNVTSVRILGLYDCRSNHGFCFDSLRILLAAQMGGILAGTAAQNMELYAIATVVIVGIAISGGKGKIIGIIFGVVTLQSLITSSWLLL